MEFKLFLYLIDRYLLKVMNNLNLIDLEWKESR